MVKVISENKRPKDENDEISKILSRTASRFGTVASENGDNERKRKRVCDEETCQIKKIKQEVKPKAEPKWHEMTKRLASKYVSQRLSHLSWTLLRSLHGRIIRPCRLGEKAMFEYGRAEVVASLTDLDFTHINQDITLNEGVSVVIFHRCECWLIFAVYKQPRNPNSKYPKPHKAKTYFLRYAECREKSVCGIQPSELNEFVHTVTNCKSAQAKFICPPELAAKQQSEDGQIPHKKVLLYKVLLDRYVMFKIDVSVKQKMVIMKKMKKQRFTKSEPNRWPKRPSFMLQA